MGRQEMLDKIYGKKRIVWNIEWRKLKVRKANAMITEA